MPGDVPLPHVRPIVHSFEVNEEVNEEAPSLGPIMTSPSPKGQTRHLHVGTFFCTSSTTLLISYLLNNNLLIGVR